MTRTNRGGRVAGAAVAFGLLLGPAGLAGADPYLFPTPTPTPTPTATLEGGAATSGASNSGTANSDAASSDSSSSGAANSDTSSSDSSSSDSSSSGAASSDTSSSGAANSGAASSAGSATAAGSTAAGDVLDQLAEEYAVGAGGGQLSNLLKASLKMRAMGYRPSRANLEALTLAMDYRPNQIPLINALKDTIAYQQKVMAQTQILRQAQTQQNAAGAVMGASQMPSGGNPNPAAPAPGAQAPMAPPAPVAPPSPTSPTSP